MSVLAGCTGQAPPSGADLTPAQTQLALQNCREFTVQVTVEGQPRQAAGQTCRQPDGSWQVTLDTPGLPQQVYTLPPQAISFYSYSDQYYWDPMFYGPPFFVGYPVFLARGFHHFHHHHASFHHSGSRHGGFHGGRR
jgi:hypothetical protein